jgi:hypothetical protein
LETVVLAPPLAGKSALLLKGLIGGFVEISEALFILQITRITHESMKSKTVKYRINRLDRSIMTIAGRVRNMSDIDLLVRRMNMNKLRTHRFLKDKELIEYNCVFNELHQRGVGQR